MLITVNAGELLKVFSELSVIFKLSEQYRAILCTYENNLLYITSNTGIRYEACLEVVKSSSSKSIQACVIFRDICEVMPSEGTIDLNIETNNLVIQIGALDVTLNQSNEILERKNASSTIREKINQSTFVATLKTISSTGFLKKAYKLSPPITLGTDFTLVKFPTVWIKGSAGLVGGNFVQEDIDVLMKFNPNAYSRINDTTVIFYNDNASMMMNCVPPTEDTMESMLQNMTPVTALNTDVVGAVLRRILKVAGEGSCTVSLSPHGFVLSLHRVGMNSTIAIGDIDDILFSFQMPLEILTGVFGMIRGDATIYEGGGRVCIKTQYSTILMSING